MADIALYAACMGQGLLEIKMNQALTVYNDMAESRMFENQAGLGSSRARAWRRACGFGKTGHQLFFPGKRHVCGANEL